MSPAAIAWIPIADKYTPRTTTVIRSSGEMDRGGGSEFNPRPKLHHPVWRQAEETCRALRIANHRREDLLAPGGHTTGPRSDDQRLASQEVRCVHRRDVQPAHLTDPLQQRRDVRLLHVSVTAGDAVDTFTELVAPHALMIGNVGHFFDDDGQEDHLCVKRLVVLETVQQRRWD